LAPFGARAPPHPTLHVSHALQFMSAEAAAAATGLRDPSASNITSGRNPPEQRTASRPSCTTDTAARALQDASRTSLQAPRQRALAVPGTAAVGSGGGSGRTGDSGVSEWVSATFQPQSREASRAIAWSAMKRRQHQAAGELATVCLSSRCLSRDARTASATSRRSGGAAQRPTRHGE
jgi:hypothetical protein